jgi:hypothetical protein
MKPRPYAVIYLDDLHIRYFDSKDETKDAVAASSSVPVLALKWFVETKLYIPLKQVSLQ